MRLPQVGGTSSSFVFGPSRPGSKITLYCGYTQRPEVSFWQPGGRGKPSTLHGHCSVAQGLEQGSGHDGYIQAGSAQQLLSKVENADEKATALTIIVEREVRQIWRDVGPAFAVVRRHVVENQLLLDAGRSARGRDVDCAAASVRLRKKTQRERLHLPSRNPRTRLMYFSRSRKVSAPATFG